MAIMDRAALSQEVRSYARQQMSTVQRRLQQHGLSAWLRLPLTVHRRQEYESRFCLDHQDGRIRVRLHRGERTLAACIRHRHSAPSPGEMVWGLLDTRPGHLFIPLTALNGARDISPHDVALPFIRALRDPTFQQDNARPRVGGIGGTFIDTENERVLP
ncbi:uncharacterized protein TNCV_1728191 [Trichonephila clavipes]|nr:uncharacterized protein TNCV_1728191 [Trichonephila clavipes]